jgi:long-chain acyl-CoA synthetase
MKPVNTLQTVAGSLASFGARPGLVQLRRNDREVWSCANLADHAQRLAVGLAAAGLRPGRQVALLAENRPEWAVAFLATILAGAVVVPVDAQLAEKSLRHVLADSEADFIFTTRRLAERLAKLDGANRRRVMLLDADAANPQGWQQLLRDPLQPLPRAQPSDMAILFYTSGTTGVPKGVPLTHANLAAQLNTIAATGFVTANDRLLLPLPLHHVYPLVIGLLLPLTVGAPIVLPHALTGPEILRALREGSVTIVLGVPRLYRALDEGLEARIAAAGRVQRGMFRGLLATSLWLRRRTGVRAGKFLLRPLHRQLGPAVRIMASGGATLDAALAWKLEALGWQVSIGYGLTETAPLLTLNPPGHARLGSVGKPIAGVELRIDDSGEVLARGPNVFAGYRHLPEETRQAFADGGWFRTGDLGHFDAEGFLYLTGRAKTLIVTPGGKKVQPEDVEAVYEAQPAIREIGVLQTDDRLVALVVPQLSVIGSSRDDAVHAAVRDAIQECSRQLPSYQRVTDFMITREPLPRTRLGKLQRGELARRYADARRTRASETHGQPGAMPVESMSEEDRALLDHPAARKIWDWLAMRYSDRSLTPATSPQLDLGVDSMEWLNLTLEISQRAGIELGEDAIARIETVRDLLMEVTKAAEAGASGWAAQPFEKPEVVLSEEQRRWLRPLGPVEARLATGLFALNRVLVRALFRLRVDGAEHLPADGPFVLTPNHVSYLDPFVVGAALSRAQLRRTHWAGWTGAAFRNRSTRFVSRLSQAVPIDPQRAVVSSLAFCAAVLQRGDNLVWFPEGERSATGRLLAFKPGIGLLLQHFNIAVVPVWISGTHDAMPVGRWLIKPTCVTVRFGRPVLPAVLREQGAGSTPLARMVAALHSRVADLAVDNKRKAETTLA